MKPCFKNRKLIAWLALGSLEAEQAAALREHLAACDGCRGYLNELSRVSAALRAAELKPEVQATGSFHRRVAARVKAEGPRYLRPTREFFPATWLNWRVALPVMGGVAVALAVLLTHQRKPDVPLPPRTITQSGTENNFDGDFRPTIGNYRMVANRSLENLDELLTEQGNKKLPPAPIYTVSTFLAAGLSD